MAKRKLKLRRRQRRPSGTRILWRCMALRPMHLNTLSAE